VVILASSAEDGGSVGTDVDGVPASGPPAEQEAPKAGTDSTAGRTEDDVVSRVVRAYIAGLDARDGARVCALLAPGAIEQIELPAEHGGCEASLDASIGYRDPRGFPVFESVRLESINAVALDPGRARVTATIVTWFADRAQPSIEEDLVYLLEDDGEWLIARPSLALYRAVGNPEAPARALAPPQ
jgi:hypothetical protein